MSDLELTLHRVRDALLRRDAATLHILERRWRVVQRRLLVDIDALLVSIDADMTPNKLRRLQQYRDLLVQVEAVTQAYADAAAPLIEAGQRYVVTLAASHAEGLVRAQLGDRVTWNTLPVTATESMIGRLADNSPLAEYLSRFGSVAAASAEETLIQGVATGKGVRVIASELAKVFGIRDAVDPGKVARQAMVTARTSVLSSYRSAGIESMKQNRDVVRSWRWRCARSTRTCLSCWAMDGTLHSLDEPFSSHVCCRCVPEPVTASYADLGIDVPEPQRDLRTGADIFAALPSTDQLTILGPSRLRLFNTGVPLSAMVGETNDRRWGKGLRQKRIGEITNAN